MVIYGNIALIEILLFVQQIPTVSTNLFTNRRFLPLFLSQISGIVIDNLYRTSFLMILFYSSSQSQFSQGSRELLSSLSLALIVLPYFLFSPIAGDMCDKYSKSKMVFYIKLVEMFIVCFGSAALAYENIPCMLATIFLLGSHTTFLSPLKLSLLPEYLADNELITGNAYIEIGTFSAILVGEIFANVLHTSNFGLSLVITGMFSLCSIGLISSLYLVPTEPKNKDLAIDYNFIYGIFRVVKSIRYSRTVYLCILGISWFWLVSGIVMTEIPILMTQTMHADSYVLTLSLAIFGVGIALGSMLCNYLLKNRIEATYVPIAAFGVSCTLYDLASILHTFEPMADYVNLLTFMSTWTNWRILLDFGLIGCFGGLYHVPLYTLMQHESPEKERARVVACHNIVSTAFVITGSVLDIALRKVFLGNPAYIFAFVSAMFFWLSLYISQIMPYNILQTALRSCFRSLYRAKITGMDQYINNRDQPLIIIANHTSWLDAIILAAFFPDKLTFALSNNMTDHWLARYFIKLNKVYLIDPTQAMSLRGLIDAVKNGEKVVMFPEGRLTVTGSLMKIYEAPALVAHKTGAKILPVNIAGMQHTVFTRMRNKALQLWPQLHVHIAPVQTFTPCSTSGKSVRAQASSFLYNIMTDISYESHKSSDNLLTTLVNAAKSHGLRMPIAEDIQRNPTSYRALLQKIFILQSTLSHRLSTFNIGLLLPTFIPTIVNFFSIQALGKTPVMLNFTHGAHSLLSCCQTANVSEIITSRKFVEILSLEPTIARLEEANIQIYYLEDIKDTIGIGSVITGYVASYFPSLFMHYLLPEVDADKPAVVLFTSGSEGKPKGVALSHNNINANIAQLLSVLDLNREDKMFNALPSFHSFGLVGALLPMLCGVQVFLYPRALHYRLITELVYDTNATILFGTDFLLNLYAQHANSYDFYSLRYVFAGAEKLQAQTSKLWFEKFGIRILEGYGLTEASPGVSFNTNMHYKAHSVGRLLPKMQYKLEPIDGIDEGGQMWLKGPNIMLGYMLNSAPGVIQPPVDGWHNTGDITTIDSDGFCQIVGRTKRFAKIAGEMISLSAVEFAIAERFPDHAHAVIAQPCPKRGEQIILCTEQPELDKKALQDAFSKAGISELWLAKTIHYVEELPRFPTGKTNYVQLKADIVALETTA